MYRDEPLDDEQELRDLLGDDEVERLEDDPAALDAALVVLRLLQGWVDDDRATRWLTSPARRLDDLTPMQALSAGEVDEVHDACRAFIAAQG